MELWHREWWSGWQYCNYVARLRNLTFHVLRKTGDTSNCTQAWKLIWPHWPNNQTQQSWEFMDIILFPNSLIYSKNYKKPVEAALDQANVNFELKFKLMLKFFTYLFRWSVMIGSVGLWVMNWTKLLHTFKILLLVPWPWPNLLIFNNSSKLSNKKLTN